MSTLRLTLFALAISAASSLGGEVYGTIQENGRPVGKGLAITITPGADQSSKQTDEFGSYRIFVPQVGACTLNLTLSTKETVSCPIQSYSKPTRFDLVLENANGTYTLRRR